ncbi:MAG: GatB/YqeY domain-containing protein [Nitrospirae bacterium]|nr:GatB/YqeY domain-containing protein [Nitrospirota bacterium]MCL5285232.1 GatB/YqeY domain-containing protein [Nitrospirota bacterium]
MGLREQILDHQKESLRARETTRLSVLRLLMAQIKNREIEKGKGEVLSDEEIVETIASMIRKMDESIEGFEKGGRSDLADKERAEKIILQAYLPEPLSEGDLDRLVSEALRETGASGPKGMGAVMQWLAPRTKGRVDNRVVSQKVKTALGS